MIFEERRRALWLEGRFWATKILGQRPVGQNTKLWFPRSNGLELNRGDDDDLSGAVRMLMQNFEFDVNENISRIDRATLCRPKERATDL